MNIKIRQEEEKDYKLSEEFYGEFRVAKKCGIIFEGS